MKKFTFWLKGTYLWNDLFHKRACIPDIITKKFKDFELFRIGKTVSFKKGEVTWKFN
jgi:hypothetical protein